MALNRRDKPNRRELTRICFYFSSFFFFFLTRSPFLVHNYMQFPGVSQVKTFSWLFLRGILNFSPVQTRSGLCSQLGLSGYTKLFFSVRKRQEFLSSTVIFIHRKEDHFKAPARNTRPSGRGGLIFSLPFSVFSLNVLTFLPNLSPLV